jgi:hypothetical protein
MITAEALIDKLQSIHESDRGAIELIAMGDQAVAALRQFLLGGKPSTVFQPRQIAVEALARIGAKEVLLEFLKAPEQAADPAVRFAEDAVRSTAARELLRWPGEEVATVLIDIMREKPLPGACDAAGQLHLNSAAPYLVDALADDFSRPHAMDALRRMPEAARPLLIDAALLWLMNSGSDENPALHRRALAAVRILSDLDVSADDAALLGPLMASEDPEMVACAARIGLKQQSCDIGVVVNALIGTLPRAPWFVRDEIRDLLAACGPDALEPLDREIHRRAQGSKRRASAVPAKPDMLLPMLVNIRLRVGDTL